MHTNYGRQDDEDVEEDDEIRQLRKKYVLYSYDRYIFLIL